MPILSLGQFEKMPAERIVDSLYEILRRPKVTQRRRAEDFARALTRLKRLDGAGKIPPAVDYDLEVFWSSYGEIVRALLDQFGFTEQR